MSISRVAVDDSILMKGMISTAGSKILGNFTPPFNSAVIDKLAAAGIAEIVQTRPNEFGASLTAGYGCVDAVAKGEADVGLGCDFNGSIRREASAAGIAFIKPTYGTVSRFGLVSAAPSMECIGVACRDVDKGFYALSLIAGADCRDGTMASADSYSFSSGEKSIEDVKVGVIGGSEEAAWDAADRLRALGTEAEAFDFPLLDYAPAAAYIISAAEASNSISRFDGIKYGLRAEGHSNLESLYVKSRSEGFTFETKLFTLAGMLVLTKEKYESHFEKALKMRRLVRDAVFEAFDRYDIVMMPAGRSASGAEDGFADFCDAYASLKYLALPNLAGVPALSLPGGIQLMAGSFGERLLQEAGRCFQVLAEKGAAI